MKIGIMKLGKQTRTFTNEELLNKSARAGDLEVNHIGRTLHNLIRPNTKATITYYLSVVDGLEVDNKHSAQFIIKSLEDLHKEIYELDVLVIINGPQDTEIAREQLELLSNADKLYKVCISTDPRFNIIDTKWHISRIEYFNQLAKNYTHNGITTYSIALGLLTAYDYQIHNSILEPELRKNDILILSNEVNSVKSRKNRIMSLVNGLSLHHITYGKWTNDEDVNDLNVQGELAYLDAIQMCSKHKYGLVVNSQFEISPQCLEEVGGVSNFIPSKFWEYCFADCLPLFDIRDCEPNDLIPKELQIRSKDDIQKIIDKGESFRLNMLKHLNCVIAQDIIKDTKKLLQHYVLGEPYVC